MSERKQSRAVASGPKVDKLEKAVEGIAIDDKNNGGPPNASDIQIQNAKVKIASWNLNCLTQEKATPPCIEAICKIIIKQSFDILACQEVMWAPAVEAICNKLYETSGTQWSHVVSVPAGQGFQNLESFAFLHKSKFTCELSRLINFDMKYKRSDLASYMRDQNDAHTVNISDVLKTGTNFVRKPFLGLFKINEDEFSLINVHFKAKTQSANTPENEAYCLTMLHIFVNFGTNVIILGDFNLEPDEKSSIAGLSRLKYIHCIDKKQTTNYGDTQHYDNIWINLNKNYTKENPGVVDGPLEYNKDGKTEPISNHRPVFVTLCRTQEIEHA